MFKFKTFSISGDKREGLEDILRFLVETQDFHPTESGYGTLCTQVDGQEKAKVLLIGSRLGPDASDVMPYPFRMTAETLAEQICQFIQSFSEEDLKAYGWTEEDWGYAEEYTIGWELFRPDGSSENKEHGIGVYYLWDVIAVKPVLIEYGK